MRRIAVIFVMFFMFFLVVGCRNKGCGKNTGVKEYDLTNISFSDINVIYDGEEHSVLLDGDLPEGLEVEYQNNKLKNVGTVSATATIKEKETQEVLKVLNASLSINVRVVKVRVNDIYIAYGEEPKDDEYKFIEGSFVESDLDELNLNIVLTKKGYPGFVATLYDAVDLEYIPNTNYVITVEKGDATIYNSELSLSDVIVYCNSDAYTEDYWKQEVLTDFEYSEQIYARINKYDINNEEYIFPWVEDGLTEVTDEQLITYGRYLEEHKLLCKDIYERYPIISKSKEEQDVAKQWYDELEEYPDGVVWDWIEFRFEYTEDDIMKAYESSNTKNNLDVDHKTEKDDRGKPIRISIDEFTVLSYLEYCGSSVEYKELVEILQISEDYATIEKALVSTCKNIIDEAGNVIKTTDVCRREFYHYYNDKSLSYLISKEPELYEDICEFDIDGYETLVEDLEYYKPLYESAIAYETKLTSWKTYYTETLLGYGGVATDYVNKPTLSCKTEDGNMLEFWFNMHNTSFILVKVDQDGNVLQTWLSNPESDSTVSFEDSIKQKSILSFVYYIFNGETGSYTTYEHSVSKISIYNDELTPSYAVNVDVENNKLVVWYKLDKSYIDYTYFPKYISKEKMDEYFERNKKLVEDGATTSSGELIIDIKSNDKLYRQFCGETYQSCYKLVPVIITKNGQEIKNPDNKFGFDYYELSFKPSKMSGIVRDVLYECLYEYSCYTEQDLISDNKMFDYEVNYYRPVFQVAVEYKLIDGLLHVSIPQDSIVVDEQCENYLIDLLPYIKLEE